MKINQIIVETTTAGAVATVAQPLGAVQKRSGNKKAGSMFKGKTTNKPFYEDQVNEEDKIISPGKGNKYKPGLLNKPENSVNPTDTIKLDVPLLIRLLEYAREDASNDLDLHDLAEKLVARGTRGKTLSMKDYEFVVDEGFGGALAGGVIGAALTKSPSGAMTGANVGSKIQNALAKESGGVVAGGGVGEGIGDTIKRGIKNVKRGMQGWGGVQGKPGEIVKRNKGYDDKTVKNLNLKGKIYKDVDGEPDPHSPQGLQNRVNDREMKKRGLDEAFPIAAATVAAMGLPKGNKRNTQQPYITNNKPAASPEFAAKMKARLDAVGKNTKNKKK